MHRSPIALFSICLLSFAFAAAQDNPATPSPGSGVPQTPVPGANPAPKQSQTPATTAPVGAQPSSNQPPTAGPAIAQPPAVQPSTPAQPSSAAQPGNTAGKQAEQGVAMPPAPPAQPKTEILDSSATSGALATDGHDPILDPAPLPRTTTTMAGGTITGVDRLRNKMTVHVFGGGHWTVNFDERTHIFHNGRGTTQLALKKGGRVLVDTQLDNNKHDIFARNIRVGVAELPADADGQIIAIDPKHNELTLRDALNSVPVRFAVDPETRISSGQTPAALDRKSTRLNS